MCDKKVITCHLGCAAESETVEVGGNDVGPGIRYCYVAWVGVNESLVINLHHASKLALILQIILVNRTSLVV